MPPALVVGHDLVEIGVGRAAELAGRVELGALEGVILEIERDDARIGRDRVDALLAPGAEELQRRAIVELGIVEFRDRRRVHDVAAGDARRIGVGRRDMAVARDVLVELDVHHAIFAERVHGARLGFARLQKAQRLGDRHLIDEDLAFAQRRLGNPVAGLDDRRLAGVWSSSRLRRSWRRRRGSRPRWSCRRRPGR